MSPGCGLLPCKLTTDGESMSCEASTMFRTGALPPLTGEERIRNKGAELEAADACAVLLLEVLPPQEIAGDTGGQRAQPCQLRFSSNLGLRRA